MKNNGGFANGNQSPLSPWGMRVDTFARNLELHFKEWPLYGVVDFLNHSLK